MRQSNKLAHTVLYLLQHGGKPYPGTTQLLKMLWFADYWHYQSHLSSITGAQYVALERGPVINDYKSVFTSLEALGIVQREKVTVLDLPEQKTEYRPLKEADEAQFAASELETLKRVLSECAGQSGATLSHRTHLEGPWCFARGDKNPGKPMHRGTFRWLHNFPSDTDLAVARKTIDARGLRSRIAELNA